MLDGEEGADQVYAQDLLPVLHRLLEQRHHSATDARIGVDDVEAAEFVEGALHVSLHVRFVARVSHHGNSLAAPTGDLLDRFRHRVGGLVHREDFRPFVSEQ